MNINDQETYFSRVDRINEICNICYGQIDDNYQTWAKQVEQSEKEALQIRQENSKLLKEQLFSLCDNVYSLNTEQIENLCIFVNKMTKGQPYEDFYLAMMIHETLLSYYRRQKNNNEIVKTLYQLGLDYYYSGLNLDPMVNKEQNRFMYKAKLCFMEGASYLNFLSVLESDEAKVAAIRCLINVQLTTDNWKEKMSFASRGYNILKDQQLKDQIQCVNFDALLKEFYQIISEYRAYFKGSTLTSENIAMVMEACNYIYEFRKQQDLDHDLIAWWRYLYFREFYGEITLTQVLDELERHIDEIYQSNCDNAGYVSGIHLIINYQKKVFKDKKELENRKQQLIRYSRYLLKSIENLPITYRPEEVKEELKQVLYRYREVEGGVSYQQIIRTIIGYHAPEIYINSMTTVQIAIFLADLLMETDPNYFDDMPNVGTLKDKDDKKIVVQQYIKNAGVFMDLGLVQLGMRVFHRKRAYLQSESEIIHHHPLIGYAALKKHKTTFQYADTALGHHFNYDGGEPGYPKEYVRSKSQYRMMTDLLTLASYIAKRYFDYNDRYEDIVNNIKKGEGKEFSPLITTYFYDNLAVRKCGDILKATYEKEHVSLWNRLKVSSNENR